MALLAVPFTMIGIIVIVALALSTIIKKLGQNEVIGFIIAGFFLGPFLLNLISPKDALIQVFSELGLFVLLFYLGLELSWKQFLSAGSAVFGLAIIDLAFVMSLGTFTMLALGYSPFFAIVIGAMLPNTSTAIIAKFVIDQKIVHLNGAKVALSINVLQDFLGIMILVLIASMSKFKGGGPFAIINTGLTAIVFAASAFYCVHYLSRKVERYIKQEGFGQVKMALYAIGIGIIVATLGDTLGLSASLGAYFAGFALSETASGKKIKNNISFLMDFFLVFFFVAFGTTIFYDSFSGKVMVPQTQELLYLIAIAILLGVLTFLGNSLCIRILGAKFGLSSEDSSMAAILLCPLGEFLIVIAQVVSAGGLLSMAEAKAVNFLAFLLIIITILLFQPVYNYRHLHERLFSLIPKLPKSEKKTILKANTPYVLKQAKSMAANAFIVVCLALMTVFLYYDLPHFGVPIMHSREVTAFLVFCFFAAWPAYKALLAFRRILRHSIYSPI
ncbi:MAG: cation:proton antiporter [Candidatus Diapherotrites archaeon]|nr:cation:proton antiporter [Candidatus Diapherotrites archaeon]